jgi:hypothetical protein
MAKPMTLPKELEFQRPTVEEKYYRAVNGYMRRLCAVYESIYEKFGEDGLDLIREVSREYGESIGRNVKKKGELKGVAQVGRYLLRVFDMVSDDWSVPEFSEDRLVISVSRCPYPFRMAEICEAHTNMERALVETLDEDLDYRIGRSIPKGDAFCEHILCRKANP